ncbi:hypothetical protein KSP40_PGU002082 [Platanthera guangdongensis]|uniref:Mitochondrial Rho GTPase 1/3 EF hand associated type-1 domain-containing protein n=1 Tax=Platanthera guangdongensis TaxID=2320717 RepID=A0ABR2MZ17_9ASPA
MDLVDGMGMSTEHVVKGDNANWAMIMLLDPIGCLTNLLYLGYKYDYALAFHITRQRCQDLERQQSKRNVLQCFVFGPKNAGKSALLSLLVGSSDAKSFNKATKMFIQNYISTTSELFVANVLELPEMILIHIPWSYKSRRAKRDSTRPTTAGFAHPGSMLSRNGWGRNPTGDDGFRPPHQAGSDVISFNKATEMLIQVAIQGKNSSFEVSCHIFSYKDDLDSYPLVIQESERDFALGRLHHPRASRKGILALHSSSSKKVLHRMSDH